MNKHPKRRMYEKMTLLVKAGVIGWSKITKNGQITIPKEVREKLDLTLDRDFVQFLLTDNQYVVIRKFTLTESVEL